MPEGNIDLQSLSCGSGFERRERGTWSGNIRFLSSCVKSGLVMGPDQSIKASSPENWERRGVK